MAFAVGNKLGGKRKEKLFYDALIQSLKSAKAENKYDLMTIAEGLLTLAASGDIQAIKEVANRLDGTPAQTMDMNVNDNRQPRELSDADLADIATGSGDGTAGSSEGSTGLDSLH